MSTAAPQASPAPEAPGPGRAALLVAEREITTQVRSKAFLISVAVTVIIVLGGILLMSAFGGGEPEDAEVAAAELGEAQLDTLEGLPLSVTTAGSRDDAVERLYAGEAEAVITSSEESPTGFHVIGREQVPYDIVNMLSAQPTTATLEEPDEQAPLRFVVPFLFGLVFMMLTIGSGTVIQQNTIQEKQSRVVEILLSTISARSLLVGKVLGNTLMAIGQAVVIAGAAAAGLMITGQTELLGLLSAPMLWFVVFFLPGFVLVASMYAAGASLVSRQEDSGPVMLPTMMLVMLPYFLVLFFAENERVMQVASYIPFTAPVAMPVRLFFEEVAWFEPVFAMIALLAGAALVMLLAARIYSRSLLRTGQRVSLRSVLTSAE
ncbi:ABC transporter permease [Nesterenkonia populi]